MACKVCNEDKKILAKGMCSKCYQQQYTPGKFKPKPPKTKRIKPTHCSVCNKEEIYCKGKCYSCYRKDKPRQIRRENIGICSICGKEKDLVSKGRCQPCYQRFRTSKGLNKPKKKKPCKICGGEGFKLGYCKIHYDAYQSSLEERKALTRKKYYETNKDRIAEVSKAYHSKHSDVYKQRAKEWAKAHPDKVKEKNKIYGAAYYAHVKDTPKYKAKQSEYKKRRYARLKQDPEWVEKQKAYRAKYYVKRKEKKNGSKEN